jgi:hypothetical protein
MATISLKDLEDRVWSLLDGNTLEFPEAQVRAAINEALYRSNLLCGHTQALISIPGGSVVNQHVYGRPTGILIPIRIDFDGVELERISLRRLALKYPNFATDTGKPARWAPIGLRRWVIHPADEIGGYSLDVTGVAPLTPLTVSSQTITLDDQFIDLVVNYCRPRVIMKEGGKPLADVVPAYRRVQSQLATLGLWRSLVMPMYGLQTEQQTSDGKGL